MIDVKFPSSIDLYLVLIPHLICTSYPGFSPTHEVGDWEEGEMGGGLGARGKGGDWETRKREGDWAEGEKGGDWEEGVKGGGLG